MSEAVNAEARKRLVRLIDQRLRDVSSGELNREYASLVPDWSAYLADAILDSPGLLAVLAERARQKRDA